MSTTDYILDLVLIGLVLVQVRGRRLTTKAILLPVAIVGYVAKTYLTSIPTAGNDLILVIGCALIGISLGAGAGFATKVTRGADGVPIAKAGWTAAVLWILGTGSRFAFQLYASHGGGPAIGRFMNAHSIIGDQAWVAALILMALGEALTRTAVLGYRAYVQPSAPTFAPSRSDMIGIREPAV